MKVQLIWKDPKSQKQHKPKLETPIALGRAFEKLPSVIDGKRVSRIVVDDPLMAEFQAVIEESKGQLIVRDHQGKQTINIDGESFSEGRLESGDHFGILSTEIDVIVLDTTPSLPEIKTESQPSNYQYQGQDNVIKETNVRGNLVFAPVQIGTKIETQIVEISAVKVTQRPLIKASPYKGLKRFNFKDREQFFGRDQLIARLFEAVNRSNLTLVLGASGSGKSSVIRAGLIPELKKHLGASKFYNFIFTPRQDPFESLYYCLLSEEKDYSFNKKEAEIAYKAEEETLSEIISTLKKEEEKWLLFVDQFEEIFTSCYSLEKQKNFIKSIINVANSGDNSVKIILAMRADFLEQLSAYPLLVTIANDNNIHLVTDMDSHELRQAIEQPAAKHGVVFEEGLVEQIIEEVEGQKGYLPLLQYTLDLLWQMECQTIDTDGKLKIENRTLNKSTYVALQGVRGALKKRVNEIYIHLNPEEQSATEQVFIKLVNIMDTEAGSKIVSRRANRSEFVGELVQNILQTFINENLLVSNYENLRLSKLRLSDAQSLKQTATVEIAHEILLSSWDELKGWIEQEKEAIILKNWLAGETRRWQKIHASDQSKAREELLKGSRLEQIVAFRNEDAFHNIGGLRTEENEFIDASIVEKERIEREKEEQKQRQLRQARKIAIFSVAGGLIMTGLTIFSAFQWQKSEIQLIRALRASSEASLISNRYFEALIPGVKAGKKIKKSFGIDFETQMGVMGGLARGLNGLKQSNQLVGHTSHVWNVTFSPDGQMVASGSNDGTIRLWDLSGKLLHTLVGHTENITSIRFSPDGQMIASASYDDTAKLWNVSGELLQTFSGHTYLVDDVSFSPDGQMIASASWDETIKLWSLSGELLHTFVGHSNDIHEVRFSPNGQIIASVSKDKTIKLWSLSGELLNTLSGHTDFVRLIEFSPDGQMIASASNDQTVRLWSISGQLLQTLAGHTDLVDSVSFSPNGEMIASAGNDGVIKVWSVSGRLLKTLSGHEGWVNSVSFSPDGEMIASAGDDKTVKLWNLSGELQRTLTGHTDRVHSVDFSPDGQMIASSSSDDTVILWNLEDNITTLKGYKGSVSDLSFSPDGQIIASAGDDTIKLWNLSGELRQTLSGQTSSVDSISFSPDGQMIAFASARDEAVKLWNLSEESIQTLPETTGWVYDVKFSPDGQTIAASSQDGTIQLWNLSGQLLQTFSVSPFGSAFMGLNIHFSPDGQMIAAVSGDYTIKLWNLSGELVQTLSGHETQINSIAFSPDGQMIVSGSEDKTVKLWNLSGELVQTFSGHTDGITQVLFSPDGQTITSASRDKTIKLWNLSGDLLHNLSDHTQAVFTISFSPDGQILASGGTDNMVKLWNVSSGRLIDSIQGHTSWVYQVMFSPDGKILVSGGGDGIVKLWNLDLDWLMERSCDRIRNYLQHNPDVSKEDRHLCDGLSKDDEKISSS